MLAPIKTASNNISDNDVLPTLWQQFLFRHDNASVQKARSLKKKKNTVCQVWCGGSVLAHTEPSNTLGINWNAECEPGLSISGRPH